MRSKQLKLEGPLHKIKVRYVSQRTIDRAAGSNSKEIVRGCYMPDENLIYVCNSISEEEQLHVTAHELIHAVEFQTSGLEEESRVDIIAKFLLQFAGFKSIKELPWRL